MNKPLVSVINLGCPKNRVDAEIILGQLAEAGFELSGDPAQAGIVIINTCAFLEEAIHESAGVIKKYQELRRYGKIERLLVTGCLPQREPREIVGRFPWVDAFVGLDAIPKIPEVIKDYARPGTVLVSTTPAWNPGSEFPRLISTPRHYAYLRLAEGCSNCCSYCTIPMIRGSLRLREPDDILKEARNLAALGTKELILIAQDTAAHPGLSEILAGLEEIEELCWIRLLYAHPAHLDEKILQQIGSSDKILNYIDMPIQHLADSVLGRMNRKTTSARIGELVSKARGIDSNFALRTTVMIGFPGETDEEFEELMGGLERLRFTHLGVFVYSQEEQTPAYSMQKVPWEVIQERLERMMEFARKLQGEEVRKIIGKKEEAIVDFVTPNGVQGRLWSSAPEIDRIVEIEDDGPPGDAMSPGSVGKVEITGGKDDIFSARWIESC